MIVELARRSFSIPQNYWVHGLARSIVSSHELWDLRSFSCGPIAFVQVSAWEAVRASNREMGTVD